MAFKLTKKEQVALGFHTAELDEKRKAIAEAIEAYNGIVEEMVGVVNEAIDDYNSTFNEVKQFAEEIKSRLEEEHGNKSETWQEGDRGQAAQEMIDEWASYVDRNDIDEMDPEEQMLDEPEDIDDDVDQLDSLPTELDA